MPRQFALLLCIGLIWWLFRCDKRLRKLPSTALWVPALWLGILGCRPLSYWMGLAGWQTGGANNQEGNPLDLAFFLGLMIAATIILVRRKVNWQGFVFQNKVLVLTYVFLALSATWAEEGFPTLKRSIKDFGCVLVALVLHSEKSPFEAIKIICVRLSYLLFPLSVLFIKYYPDIGRVASRGGDAMFCGVAGHKNTLGLMVFVFGLIIVADLMELRQNQGKTKRRKEIRIRYVMLAMGLWLLITCDSATALLCFILGCVLVWWTGRLLRARSPQRILFRAFGILVAVLLIEAIFRPSAFVFQALGRDETLTGRTEIWAMVKEAPTNPIVGCGFYSYWSTESALRISEIYLGTLTTAHNGFLEMYLDGGIVGVGLLVTLLLIGGKEAVRNMLAGTLFGRIRITFWVLALLYNNSETSFFRLEPLWFMLLVVMIDARKLSPQQVAAVDDVRLPGLALGRT
jgi:exopolysaccharide production protein ExoQ